MARIGRVGEDFGTARRKRAPGRAEVRVLARGDGWTVEDVVCTSAPQDRPFEDWHSSVSIAIVTAGSFPYRFAVPFNYGT